MAKEKIIIKTADSEEFEAIGNLMVSVYSQLDGFPKQSDQPEYYKLLQNVGVLTKNPDIEIVIAKNSDNIILGAIVLIYDMKYYGSGGTATQEKNAAGFRLLAVSPNARGQGIGRKLTVECIKRIEDKGIERILIHTTKAMQTAWGMYEKIGFTRYENIDFMQGKLAVFGFQMENNLKNKKT